jgi:hypothetical protein
MIVQRWGRSLETSVINGNLLARGDGFGRRLFDFAGGSIAEDACLLGSGRRLILDVDRFEAILGDAKRHRSRVVEKFERPKSVPLGECRKLTQARSC